MRKSLLKITTIVCMVTMLMGCGNKSKNTNSGSGDSNNGNSSEVVEINLWSYFDVSKDLISEFEAEHPNIKVNCKSFEYSEYEEAYKDSLIKEEGEADLFIIDSNEYGNFNSTQGLEDLSKADYTANKYKDDFDPELWEVGKSLDKEKLYGLTISSAPIVTYYRKDILEEYGFPGEPEELAEFMKDENNWLEMAKKLKSDGISVLQWYPELVKIATANMPYFDENLEYKRDNDDFKNAILRTIEAKQFNLAASNDIWLENGKKLLKDGKLAMLYLGSWGAAEIEAIAPEQAGKWRVTSLPFGVYGWNNASILSMAENSKNKDAAWKFIEYYIFKYNDKLATGSAPGYLPLRDLEAAESHNDFLGGQDERAVYNYSMNRTKEYPVTPLDEEAFKIWDNAISNGINEELSADEIMTNIRIEIENRFKDTKEALIGKS